MACCEILLYEGRVRKMDLRWVLWLLFRMCEGLMWMVVSLWMVLDLDRRWDLCCLVVGQVILERGVWFYTRRNFALKRKQQ